MNLTTVNCAYYHTVGLTQFSITETHTIAKNMPVYVANNFDQSLMSTISRNASAIPHWANHIQKTLDSM